jgi:RHS repeat-associated protein
MMSLAMVTTVFTAPGFSSAATPTLHLPTPQQVTVLPHTEYSGATHDVTPQKKAAVPATPPATAWPAAASASVNLTAAPGSANASSKSAASQSAQTAPHQAGTLPVAVNWPKAAKSGPTGVKVRMLAHASATAVGVSGVIMSLTPTDTASGSLSVALNYSSFRQAAGGDYGDRLRLVELPACALTTPKLAACRTQTPLASSNDGTQDVVSAQVALSGAGTTSSQTTKSMVLAAVSGTSGGNGDYTASSLSPSGTWNEGGAAGNFTWTYPIGLPSPAAGSAPTLALNYDSSSVDGRIATTNNQFGPIGEGFTLTSSSITRSYTDCADDPEGAIAKDYDQCWAGQVVTLSLDGKSTPLVVDSSGKWHEQQDSGDQVQYLTGSAADTNNGTYDNGYWVVTTTDGTRYYFGKNEGPGWKTGDPVTNSTWTEPVYGAHPGDPCYSSAGFAASSCSQAWQWNLDFVVDPHGNASAYYYNVETNVYSADNPSYTVTANNDASYDRDGYPTSIDYGLREDGSGSIYNSPASDQVEFSTAERCNPSSSFSCDSSLFTAANAADWPDTPQDLQCLPKATCSNYSPTIWSTKRITGITTQYYNGSGYTKLDNYTLNQNLTTGNDVPACGNVKDADPEMLLCSVGRTGFSASGASIAMPPVSFTYQAMANRVAGYNDQPSMIHWRLTNIATDTGGTIDVTYSSGCTASTLPASPSTNTTLCYPVNWTPPFDTTQISDYFDKYVVSSVEQQDGTAGSPDKLTSYQYYGLNHAANVAAWHYDDDELVKAADRTWGQFRGFAEVDTYTGDPKVNINGAADAQSLSTTLYYLGMNGDTLPNNGTRAVSLKDSLGETVPDDDNFADTPYETETFNGPGGAELTDTITNLTTLAVTGSRARTGLPALQSVIVQPTEQRAITPLAAGGTGSTTTTTSYDSVGRPILVDSTGTSVPETCTQTTYAGDPASNPLKNKPSEVITAQQACPAASGSLTATGIISDTRTYYDGSTTLGALPGPGDATETDRAGKNVNGTLAFVKTEAGYDAMGRQTSSTDPDQNTTTTTYTPTVGGPLTGESTQNARGQQTTETFDPGRGSTLSSTDIAGYLTTSQYDALGRLTAVWNPGRSQASGATANVTYAYQVSTSAPLAVTTNTLVDYGSGMSYVTSISIYDSFGQLRQTQTAAEGGNMVVTDSFYNTRGLVWLAHNKYVTNGAPTTNLIVVTDTSVSDRRINTYDASGRLVQMAEYNGSTLTNSTQTVYGGDRTTTINRDGSGNVIGTPMTTISDVRGNTTQKDQYTAAPTVLGSLVSGGTSQATTTTFDALGNATKITDPAGNVWSYGYDLLGHQTSETDPDTGTTTKVYDAAGNLSSTTDARGVSDNYTYDQLNRKTGEYTGSTTPGSGTEVASWTWDTLAAGKLTSSSTYKGTDAYTTAYLGYDSYGNTTGTKITIPTSQTGLAGTYKTQNTYSSTGLMMSLTPANGGGLPIDSIGFTYDNLGNATSEAGYDTYVSNVAYTPYNELSQVTLGAKDSTYAAALTYGYDPQTRKTTDVNLVDLQPAPQVDDTQYTYNVDGQTTKIADTQGATGTAPVDTQCFSYDGLNRMTEAWTATDSCAADPVSAGNATVGGPSPYWQSWTFDSVGDRLSQTDHAIPGSSPATVATTYNYGVAGHAHAIASTQATGSAASTNYLYDQSGDMTTAPGPNTGATLTWNQDGKLAADGTTSYVYDADGNELIQSDAGSSTLYLPGEQITYTKSTAATTGVRSYTFDGQTIAESDGTTLSWLDGSLDGSKTLAVNAFNQSDITRRAVTPYGDSRGGSSSGTAAWPDNRGFLNDPTDQATGLTDIGARQYDAVLGIFISPDLLLDTNAPQSMTGYGYGGDNPLMNPDFTGESWWDDVTAVVNKVADIAAVAAPVLDVVAAATSFIPGVDVVTAAVAGAANIVNGVAQIAAGTVNVINDVRGGKGWLQTGLDAANIVMGAAGVSAGRNALSAAKGAEGAADEVESAEGAAKDEEPAPKEEPAAKPKYTIVDPGNQRVTADDATAIWAQWEEDWAQSDYLQGPTEYSQPQLPGDEKPLHKPENYVPEHLMESAEKGAHEGLDTVAESKENPHDPHVDYHPIVLGGPEYVAAIGIMAYAGARKMLQLLMEGK